MNYKGFENPRCELMNNFMIERRIVLNSSQFHRRP